MWYSFNCKYHLHKILYNIVIFVSEGKIKVYDVMNKTLEIMEKDTFRNYLINLVQLDEEIYEEN